MEGHAFLKDEQLDHESTGLSHGGTLRQVESRALRIEFRRVRLEDKRGLDCGTKGFCSV